MSNKLRGILKYNEEAKLNFEELLSVFSKKNYNVITKNYINNKQELEFICYKHPKIGIQHTNAIRLRRIEHNCEKCQEENNQLKMISKIQSLDPLVVYKQVLSQELKSFPNGFFLYIPLSNLKDMILYYLDIAKKEEKVDDVKLFTHKMFKKYKLAVLSNNHSLYNILQSIFPNKYKMWDLSCPPGYWKNKYNVNSACQWFYNKLYEDKVIKNDKEILSVKNYGKLFKKYNLDGMFTSVFNSSHYLFWNHLFPNKWFQWEYHMTPKHYWESPLNRTNALKQFIENHLTIQIDDIPLRISYPYLVKHHRKFSAICDIYYESNLFNWINEVYPNTFIKEDFYDTVAEDGTVLDSKIETTLHNIFLKNKLHLQYSENKQSSDIKFYNDKENESYIPDWIIDNKIVIEYFGWHNEKQYGKNKIITKYMDKSFRKKIFFSQLDELKFIDLYPYDIENNYSGLLIKFKQVGIQLIL